MDFSIMNTSEKSLSNKPKIYESKKSDNEDNEINSRHIKPRCLTEIDVSPTMFDSSPLSQMNSSTKEGTHSFLSKKSTGGSYCGQSILGTPKSDFILENVVFKKENDFIDLENCNVCGVDFSKKFGLHILKKRFCNVCGKAICRVCSKRKINGKRACDLCLLRLRSKNVIYKY